MRALLTLVLEEPSDKAHDSLAVLGINHRRRVARRRAPSTNEAPTGVALEHHELCTEKSSHKRPLASLPCPPSPDHSKGDAPRLRHEPIQQTLFLDMFIDDGL